MSSPKSSARLFVFLLAVPFLSILAGLPGCSESIVYVDVPGPAAPAAVTLTLDRAWPLHGSSGDRITVYGHDFGDTSQLTASEGGVTAPIIDLRKDHIVIVVPEGGGDSITVTRTVDSSSVRRSVDFRIIRARFLVNRFELKFIGMLAEGVTRYDDSKGTAYENIGIDTLRIDYSRIAGSKESDVGCPEVSNGDTVRLCYQNSEPTTGPHPEQYTQIDDRSSVLAYFDTTRRVISFLRVRISLSKVEHWAMRDRATTIRAQELRIENVPYVVQPDGSVVGTITGEAIAEQLSRNAARYTDISSWNYMTVIFETRNNVENITKLLPSPQSKIVITLNRVPQP